MIRSYPADFEVCDAFRAHHEGGISDDPDDIGGYTAFGLAARWWADEYPAFFANPTPEGAKEIFFVEFYRANSVGRFPIHYQVVFYDLAVNHAPNTARKIMQRGLGGGLVIDGRIGPRTLARADADDGRIVRIGAVRAEHYGQRVIDKPSQRKFLRGWQWRNLCLAVYATAVRDGNPIQPNGKRPRG